MATSLMSSANLPSIISSPISTQNREKMVTGFGLSKTSFLCGSNNTKKLFSSQSKRVLRFRKFKPFNAATSFDHIPKQFREENLKEGLMENYKNVPEQLYGLSPSQMNMFSTKDSLIYRQSAKLKEESLSSARSYSDNCGMWSMSGMKDGGQSIYCSMNTTGTYRGGYGRRTRGSPPDLPSLLLDGRIVYLGMPMVEAVTELIVAQLVYLLSEDPTKPIYLYINSLGIKNEQGQNVADPINAYVIADHMAFFESRIYTVNLGCAYGQAAMLLSLGTKGYRFLQPSSTVKLNLPSKDRMNGQMTDIYIEAKDLQTATDTYLEFLSKGIGKPAEVIRQDIRRSKFFDAEQAMDYGIADKLVPPQYDLYDEYDKARYESKNQKASPRSGGAQAAPFES